MQLLPNDIYGFWDDRLFKHIRSHIDNRKEANKKEESRNKMPTHMNIIIIIMVRTGWMNV